MKLCIPPFNFSLVSSNSLLNTLVSDTLMSSAGLKHMAHFFTLYGPFTDLVVIIKFGPDKCREMFHLIKNVFVTAHSGLKYLLQRLCSSYIILSSQVAPRTRWSVGGSGYGVDENCTWYFRLKGNCRGLLTTFVCLFVCLFVYRDWGVFWGELLKHAVVSLSPSPVIDARFKSTLGYYTNRTN